MADDLTDDEKEIIRQHRAKAKPARKVRVYGKHDAGEYEFELDGDEAEGVISRHRGLWESDEPADDAGTEPAKGKAGKGKAPDASGVVHFGRRMA